MNRRSGITAIVIIVAIAWFAMVWILIASLGGIYP